MTDAIIQDRRRGMLAPRVRSGYYQGYRDPDPISRGADTAAARAEHILNMGGWLSDVSTAVLEKPLAMPVRVTLPPARRGEGVQVGDAIDLFPDQALCSLSEIAKYRPGTKVGKRTARVTIPKKIFSQQIRDVDLYTGQELAKAIIHQITLSVIQHLSAHLEVFIKEVPQLKLINVPANNALPKISGETHERILGNGRSPTLFTGVEAWKMLYASARGYPDFPTYGEKVFGVNLHKTSLLPERRVIGSGNLEDGLAAACSPIAYKQKNKTVVFAIEYAWAVTSPEEFRRYEIIPDAEGS